MDAVTGYFKDKYGLNVVITGDHLGYARVSLDLGKLIQDRPLNKYDIELVITNAFEKFCSVSELNDSDMKELEEARIFFKLLRGGR